MLAKAASVGDAALSENGDDRCKASTFVNQSNKYSLNQ